MWVLPTAHMIQGATLDAAFVDAQGADSRVSLVMQVAAYVCLSRVKELLKICVLQPFSTLLFTRGPPTGPHRLIRKLEGSITEQASDEWWNENSNEQSEEMKKTGDPMKVEHLCTSCYLQGRTLHMRPAKDFGITKPEEFFAKFISQGCWSRCLRCQQDKGVQIVTPQTMTTSSDSQKNQKLCLRCHEKGLQTIWRSPLTCDTHGCGKCKNVFSKGHWPATKLDDHKRRNRDLVCNVCAQKGFSPGKYEDHTCSVCEKIRTWQIRQKGIG